MVYRLALGTAEDADVVEHEAQAGSIRIGDEIQIDGAMWIIYELASLDRGADFVVILSAPPVVLMLDAAGGAGSAAAFGSPPGLPLGGFHD